ncbi:MAG: hypothetical protein M1828_000549 [Chrysothrix sp. TS-e1954]|nr:MAG: hypothetical protein M1828_000549 [Chrysothrix sp. TS-e1954]
MATAAAVDWSWGQSYSVPTLKARTPACTECGVVHGPQAQHPANWLTSREFRINEFRMAVPNLPTSTQEIPQARRAMNLSNTSKTAGCKRSCAEISDDDSSPRTTSSHSNESPSPTLGVQMNGEDTVMDAGMQTPNGVWAEELAARLQSSSFPGYGPEDSERQRRPTISESRKSIRLDPKAASSDVEGLRGGTIEPLSASRAVEEQIDQASILLGQSWSSIPLSDTMLAASRGWARHIETHFPLAAARVVWRSKALPAFLVEAVTRNAEAPSRPGSPGYFLFDEDLRQGKLVAKSWERAVENLRAQPVCFEEDVVMDAQAQAALDGLGHEGRMPDTGDMEVDG